MDITHHEVEDDHVEQRKTELVEIETSAEHRFNYREMCKRRSGDFLGLQ